MPSVPQYEDDGTVGEEANAPRECAVRPASFLAKVIGPLNAVTVPEEEGEE